MNDKSTNRRSFLKNSFALSVAGVVSPSIVLANIKNQEDSAFKIIAEPCLQTSFGNTISVIWILNKNAFSWVEYGLSPENLDLKAYGKSKLGLKPIGTVNVIQLENLEPDKTYYYRVVSKEILNFQPYKLTYGATLMSDVSHFINPDTKKSEVKFLVMNDIHDRPKSIQHLLDTAKSKSNDFVFFNGDMFDYQTDEAQIINHFLQPCSSAFAKTTPFVYVRGNHETRGKYCREFSQYFDKIGYNAFTLGPVRFVILDTGEDKNDNHPVYAGIVDFDAYREEQAEKLKLEIASKEFRKAKFKVVMMHIPPCFGGDAPGELHCNQVFNPLLNKAKVDLVISGHTHRYKVHLPNEGENHYPIIVGGGPREGQRTIIEVSANTNELKLSMLDDTGKEVGTYNISK